MTSNYQVAGTDLDSLLAPLHTGWPTAGTTNDQVAGTDLDARYAPLSTGTAPATTNYQVAGKDLNEIFAAYGSTGVQVLTQPSNVSGSSAAGNPSGTVTSGTATCAGAKGGGSYTYTWHTTNCTANSPNSASTTFAATVNAGSTDNASAYCTISDGVTSVNTNTIAVALTNTTPAAVMGQIVAGTVTNSTGIFTGFDDSPNGYGIGSWSVTSGTIPNGGSIQTLYDALIGSKAPSTAGVVLSITDLSADPGQDWFTTVVSNGVSLSASAATYSYSSGVATWNWSSTSFGFSSGTTYPVQLNL